MEDPGLHSYGTQWGIISTIQWGSWRSEKIRNQPKVMWFKDGRTGSHILICPSPKKTILFYTPAWNRIHDASPSTHLLRASVSSSVNGAIIDLSNVLQEPPVSHLCLSLLISMWLCQENEGKSRGSSYCQPWKKTPLWDSAPKVLIWVPTQKPGKEEKRVGSGTEWRRQERQAVGHADAGPATVAKPYPCRSSQFSGYYGLEHTPPRGLTHFCRTTSCTLMGMSL